ncbi:MAG: hypothetical protein RI998_383 [Pseudomonadota bacterium]
MTLLDETTLTHLQSWEGHSVTVHDQITAAPVRGLAATLDRNDPAPIHHSVLPPLWHWLYFLPQARQSEIGPDGHPLRGGFLPPVPYPRRMWAGGRVTWHAPLRVGEAAHRVSTVKKIHHKQGRSGALLFVLVEHCIHNEQGLCITEEHDIVYRPLQTDTPSAPPLLSSPPTAGAWTRQVVPDETLLFRYSALTFNGHRIHYDRDYCTQVEGYPGLVVHGPLLATLLMDLVQRHSTHSIASLSYKALQPCFECGDRRAIHLHGQPRAQNAGVDLWIQDAAQQTHMQATALFH